MMDIAPGPPQSLQEQVKKRTGLGAILYRLTEPAAAIREPERRRRARLLSALLVTQFLLSLLSTVLIAFTVNHPSSLYVNAGSALIQVVAYYLSRTRYYNAAALLAVGTLAGPIFVTEAINPDPGPLYFLILGVLVSSLFLSRRATVLITMALIIGIGLLTWASFPALPARDAIGAMFAVVCVGALGMVGTTIRQQDLEEIQRQSISLRQSEERFHLISFATNDVVWDWDLLTGQVWRNQSAQRLFGFSEDQISPLMIWWEKQIHPDEREKVAKSLRAAIDSGETFWSKEYRFRRADGSYIHVFDRAYITHDESGRAVRMLGAIMDITARTQAEAVLREESAHDLLTGMFNRRYMEEMLEREISRAERNRQQISIIMLDVDHFKQVNDKLGHAAGDSLLHVLGVFLLGYVRGADIACRYGGDEFILIMPGAPLDVAQQRAQKICEAVRGLIIEPYGDLIGKLTLSLGVAVFPEQGSTRQAILAAVDAALYAAKEAGRDQVAVAK